MEDGVELRGVAGVRHQLAHVPDDERALALLLREIIGFSRIQGAEQARESPTRSVCVAVAECMRPTVHVCVLTLVRALRSFIPRMRMGSMSPNVGASTTYKREQARVGLWV